MCCYSISMCILLAITTTDDNKNKSEGNYVCRWGFTSVSGEQADVLQMVELLPVPLTECRDQYEAGIITKNMICAAAANKDSCFVSHSIFTFTSLAETPVSMR